MGARVLVVEDDDTVADVVAEYLRRAGYDTTRCADGTEGLRAAVAPGGPDLVVLDLMLPGLDGLAVARGIRSAGVPAALIILSALGEEEDRVAGLEVGADDYLTKPFSPRELVLRVDSVLRRLRAVPGVPKPALLHSGGVTLDLAARTARRDSHELALTVREFDLLAFLLRHRGHAFGRKDLLERVWGWSFGDASTVTVHIRRLREKLETDPSHPELIATVWGVGYRWAGPD